MRKSKLGKKIKYSPELRKFAFTLSFSFLLKHMTMCITLPQWSTIGKWFKHDNARPGFTNESFDSLKLYVQLSNNPSLGVPIIDEISIRKKHWVWWQKISWLCCDVDFNDDRNAVTVAKEALIVLDVEIAIIVSMFSVGNFFFLLMA